MKLIYFNNTWLPKGIVMLCGFHCEQAWEEQLATTASNMTKKEVLQ